MRGRRLIATWTHRAAYAKESKSYRLIEDSAVYKETTYLLEVDKKGSLGEPRWEEINRFSEAGALGPLIGLIESLQQQIKNIGLETGYE